MLVPVPLILQLNNAECSSQNIRKFFTKLIKSKTFEFITSSMIFNLSYMKSQIQVIRWTWPKNVVQNQIRSRPVLVRL